MKIINRSGNQMEVPEKRYKEMLRKDEVKETVKEVVEEEPKVASKQEFKQEDLKCPVCGFTAASKLGLMAHQKKHKNT